eukprot:TRINITY_DN18458_c0_g1_i2.p1 TRINITY_DN18458_c0_g1~~TRINITY_DN18458_c0_g1_i2.p1  ORF type:complete len:1229 (+),score=349.19 TRINITY_DN18458_c0_g1_i2:15-3701(+)
MACISDEEWEMIGNTETTAQLTFTLNVKQVTVPSPDPQMRLVEYIRDVAGLSGTKRCCNEGGCGACTVLLSRTIAGKTLSTTVNACLRKLCSVQGQAVTTVEHLGDKDQGYNTVQDTIARNNASQCGFCTPGMVMSIYGALASSSEAPTPTQMETCLDGNLCRCTGYRPILDSAQQVASSWKPPSNTPVPGPSVLPLQLDARQGGVSWTCATSVEQACSLYSAAGSNLLCGNTGSGVAKYYSGAAWGVGPEDPTALIDLQAIPGFSDVTVGAHSLTVGAAVTLSELKATLAANAAKSVSFEPLVAHMDRIANNQVRNAGSWAGNLMLAHEYPTFVSDLNTIMIGAGASVEYANSMDSTTHTCSLEDFQSNDSLDRVILTSLTIPFMTPTEHFKTYKVALRYKNSHAILNAAFHAILDGDTFVSAELCYGGVKSKVTRAHKTEALLVGKSATADATLQTALACLEAELGFDPMFGRTEYRQGLAKSFLFKFFLELQPTLPAALLSAKGYTRPVSTGAWSIDGASTEEEFPISKPIQKLSAWEQTSGEADYIDDAPPVVGELHGAFALANAANREVTAIHCDAAKALEGVHSVLTAADLKAAGMSNSLGGVFDAELWAEDLLVDKQADYCGQPLAIVIATTRLIAEHAATLVTADYCGSDKVLLTIDDAIEAESYHHPIGLHQYKDWNHGDPDGGIKGADIVFEGMAEVGHQYHFYMETQAARAVPTDGGMVVTCGTQFPKFTQGAVASVTKLATSKVEVKMTRTGGGYGGKISRSAFTAAAAAAAAVVSKMPVRIQLDLNANMAALGSRRPHRLAYKVGCKKDGTIVAVTGSYYTLQGRSLDLIRAPAADEIKVAIDNCYNIPNWGLRCYNVKTHTPTNTWARAPNYGPGVFMMESIIERAAAELNLDSHVVRSKNMYKAGDSEPGGQKLAHCNIEQLTAQVQVEGLATQVAAFNAANRWVKQGLCVVPGKFNCDLGKGLHAVVTVHDDGSVLVQHGGCEIGQGINVKVAQVAAFTLGIDMSLISIDGVSTKVASGFSDKTAGSITSEGCCASVILACNQLKKQMELTHAKLEGQLGRQPDWHQLVQACSHAGADMSAKGSYAGKAEGSGVASLPDKSGDKFQYVSWGAALAHVQLDGLTGELQLLRCDVLLDCGISLNPDIDAGQVQGAFVMGLGYMLSEEFLWDDGSKSAYFPAGGVAGRNISNGTCLLYTSPSPRDRTRSRMPSSA